MFLKAIKSKKVKHDHIAYIRQDKTGVTSKNKGHTHEIAVDVVMYKDFDEQGNMVEKQEQGGLIVVEANGHTHELSELVISEIKNPFEKEYTDKEDLDISYDLWRTAQNAEDEWYQEAINDDEFYKGKQWDASTVSYLKKSHRATLTINELKPKVDLLVGQQKQNRTDMQVLPNEEGDNRIADIYNARIKNILNRQNYEYKESDAFEDAIIVGRGALQIEIDNSKNLTGDVKIIKRNWKDVFFGEHEELDASDSEYAGVQIWHSLANLKKLYPKKYKEVTMDFGLRTSSFNVEPIDKRDYYKTKPPDVSFMKKQLGVVDLATKNYKVIEIQRKIYKKTSVIFNAGDNFYFNADGMSEADFNNAISIEGIDHTVDTDYKIRRVVFAGSVVLEKDWSIFNNINIVSIYGNKRGYDVWGLIRTAKDAQKELNKRSSQYIDIINFGARYVLLMSPEAFDSDSDYNEWLSRSTDPTYQPKLKGGFQKHVQQLQGFKYPTEIVGTINLSREAISRVMNINEAMMGAPQGERSGVAIAQKIRQGWVGNERYYDNLSLSKKRICRLIIEAIQIVDSPEKLLRLNESSGNFKDPVKEANSLYPPMGTEEGLQVAMQNGLIHQEQAMVIMQILQSNQGIPQEVQALLQQAEQIRNEAIRVELLGMLQNKDILNYDVSITESTQSPNIMMSNFLMMSEMASRGVPIPPDQLIEMMPGLTTERKNKLIQSLQQQQQAQVEAENKKSQTEIQKTLIANEGKLQQKDGK